ncbi:MAG: hypothetical protein ACAH80_18795 [Alphaproteobacteria bacterium]
MQDDFGKLSKSTDIDDTLREPDFIKKAIGLFSLRETIHSTHDRTKSEVTQEFDGKGLAAAKKPGRIGFWIGFAAAAVGAVLLFSPAGIIGGFFAAIVPGLIGGSMLRTMTRGFVKIGYEIERDAKLKEMKATRETMLGRVEGALSEMDNALITQTPRVRDEFRAAFQHAALKQAIRENGIDTKAGLKAVVNMAAAPSAPDPATVPDPDVTTDDPVKAMKTLKIRAPSASAGATP